MVKENKNIPDYMNMRTASMKEAMSQRLSELMLQKIESKKAEMVSELRSSIFDKQQKSQL